MPFVPGVPGLAPGACVNHAKDATRSKTPARAGGLRVAAVTADRPTRSAPSCRLQVPAWITGSAPPFASAAAISRISCEIFIEQYFGPHMLQKWALLKVSCGSVWS
jgi:hypothetical protein